MVSFSEECEALKNLLSVFGSKSSRKDDCEKAFQDIQDIIDNLEHWFMSDIIQLLIEHIKTAMRLDKEYSYKVLKYIIEIALTFFITSLISPHTNGTKYGIVIRIFSLRFSIIYFNTL